MNVNLGSTSQPCDVLRELTFLPLNVLIFKVAIMWRLNEIIHVKNLVQSQDHGKQFINSRSYYNYFPQFSKPIIAGTKRLFAWRSSRYWNRLILQYTSTWCPLLLWAYLEKRDGGRSTHGNNGKESDNCA